MPPAPTHANTHECQPATGSLCRSRSNNSSLPSFCEYSRFRILNHVLCRVPLDKSEGVVKTEISWAVREHRLLCQRRLRTKTLEISPESLCGGVVPPTIDST